MLVRGVDLAVQESGEGVPFLWGHGLMGSVAQEDAADLIDWIDLAEASRLIRYDARGHGRSEVTLDPADYRWPELAQDLLSVADVLGAERAVFGGLSMGCATALHAAAAAPDRVRGLVLVAPPTAWETRARQARVYRALAGLIERFGLAPIRCVLSLARLLPAPPHLARLRRSMEDALRRADPRALVVALRGAAESDLPDPGALAAVAAPVLVLAWRHDSAHPVSTAKRLIELFPSAELHVAESLDDVRGWSLGIRTFLATLATR
jgi:pimeloyl-ACP methyl ester carboxylesterase